MKTLKVEKKVSDYLYRHAELKPFAEAVVFDSTRLNYAELANKVLQCAKALVASGIKKGDRVAVLSTPRTEYWITFLATVQIGAIWVGLNPKYRLQEMQYIVEDSAPKLLFAIAGFEDDCYIKNISALCLQSNHIKTVVSLTDPFPQSLSFESFLATAASVDDNDFKRLESLVDAGDPALLVYTSGSTGQPKGALLSHYGLCFGASVADQHLALEHPRMLCNFPVNHVACVADTCCVNLIAGGALIFHERFDAAMVLDTVSQERLTLLGGVPTMLLMILEHPNFDATDFSSIKLVGWGGAAMPVATIQRLQHIAPRLINVYGLTETAANTTYTSPDADIVELSETIGCPSPYMPCRIMNEQGVESEVGEEGELQFKGEYLLLEYLNRPEATRDVYTEDGWLHTGDLGYWRENGTITLVGRLSDMFKSGGYNVYPREVEDILESYPVVEMAAVVAVPDTRYQEVGAAFIQVRDPSAFDIDALRAYCKTHLANYKIPKTFSMLKALPVLPIGKVDKVSLKQKAIAQQKETA